MAAATGRNTLTLKGAAWLPVCVFDSVDDRAGCIASPPHQPTAPTAPAVPSARWPEPLTWCHRQGEPREICHAEGAAPKHLKVESLRGILGW